MKLARIISVVSLIAGSSFVSANDIRSGLQIGKAGYADKGDEFTINFTNGTSEKIKAGKGLSIGTFAIIPLSDQNFSIKFAANYLYESVRLEGSKITFSRFPVDALVLKEIDKWQFAAGLTYHLNSELKVVGNTVRNTDDPLGLLFEASYQVYSKDDDSLSANIGVRYTQIEYYFENSLEKYDGSNFAITASVTL